MQHVDHLGRRLRHPGERIANRLDQLTHLRARLAGVLGRSLDLAAQRLHTLRSRVQAARPDWGRLAVRIDSHGQRLRAAATVNLERRALALVRLSAHLQHLNPQAVLDRGYSIVRAEDGSIVRDAAQLHLGQRVVLALARGRAGARIEDKD